ncbi:MAG: antibiotic biosynthesis monooxygenase family protein [Sphingomonadales bacterium]
MSTDFPYVAMNRFKINRGKEAQFEEVWRSRDSHLASVPGFKSFTLLKGPENDDHTLYASHSIWESRDAFVAWTKSDAFRMAHKNAGDTQGVYQGHPEFEGFEAVDLG